MCVGVVQLILLAALVLSGAAHAGGLDIPANRRFFSGDPQSLSLEPAGGKPAALKVLKNGQLAGYLFSSFAVTGSLGFSGKPVDIHVGLGVDGRITGARLVAHNEPILVLGISPKALEGFVSGFTGFQIRTKLVAGRRARGVPDAVSGASVSSGVIRDAIIRSARSVAFAYNLFGDGRSGARIKRSGFTERTWAQLAGDGSIGHRKITIGEKNTAFGLAPGGNAKGAFIDLYTAIVTAPVIGQNLLGALAFNEQTGKTGIAATQIMIAANGLYSFRGRAWRKSGVFDRIEIVQGTKTLRLTKKGYQPVERFKLKDAPQFREIALFTLPAGSGFDPVKPWQLALLAARKDGSGVQQIRTFVLRYQLPDRYITGRSTSGSASRRPENPRLWLDFWVTQKLKIAGVLIMLAGLTGILFFQDYVAGNKPLYQRLRLGFLLTTLLFLGLYAGAQLSVINVITFVHSLMGGFRWELFLLNPMVFILWGFVALAMLFWGRGVYCGWLCPFGALQELVNKIARRFKVRQIELSWGLHERLWPIKYIAFLAILAVSLSDMNWAFRLAEIEPFKTVIILKFMREWQFVLYPVLLLAAGLFIERFYCRYLCPLGAALAIPARLRMFEWLNRRHQCGRECRICNTTCTVQAINPLGQISPNECIYCLRCQVNYYDKTTCKPLVERARRKARLKQRTQSAPDNQTGSGPATEITANGK